MNSKSNAKDADAPKIVSKREWISIFPRISLPHENNMPVTNPPLNAVSHDNFASGRNLKSTINQTVTTITENNALSKRIADNALGGSLN